MIRMDLHLHTNLSSCANKQATVEGYVKKARDLGIEVLGFSNHMWDARVKGASEWYAPQTFEHIMKIKEDFKLVDTSIKLLLGCETECDKNGVIGISEEAAKQLDFILVPNSHTHMDNFTIPVEEKTTLERHAKYLVKKFMDIVNHPLAKYFTAIAHPFHAVGCKEHEEIVSYISDYEFEQCFMAARKLNIALEINTSVFYKYDIHQLQNTNYIRMLRIAKEIGCKFTIGSDSHSLEKMETLSYADHVMRFAGITSEDLLLL